MYEDHKRETETVTFQVKRYRIDGMPTCSSWVGDEGHPREVCEYLGTLDFGTKYICMALGARLFLSEDGLIQPDSQCKLWNGRIGDCE